MPTPPLHTPTTTAPPTLLRPPLVVTAPHGSSSSYSSSSPLWLTWPSAGACGKRDIHRAGVRVVCSASGEARTVNKTGGGPFVVHAVATVVKTVGGELSNLGIKRGLNDIVDLIGKSLLVELASSELDPKTGQERSRISAYARRTKEKGGEVTYEADFTVTPNFGEIGAVFVENEYKNEMYLRDIVFSGFPDSTVSVRCNSWVHAKSDNPEKRVFFTNKAYLPSQTPSGLRRLRVKELAILRGNGTGERKKHERVYDYDVYNDLGNPDKGPDSARPVLGGKEHPYPRRCRTGRPPAKADPKSEKRSGFVYVPRDENFEEIKQATFSIKTLSSVLKSLVPALKSAVQPKGRFPHFTAIDTLFDQGIPLPRDEVEQLKGFLPRLLKAVADSSDDILLFESPELIDRDKFAWFRDEEFARQTLAGLNPLSIELLKEFPIKSKLDPKTYGPAESAITKEILDREMEGEMTVEEALKQKRLFILDYHDKLLPYVHKVRQLEGTTLYGSRTIFFLRHEGALQPIAIELTRPASPSKPQWKRAFTRCYDATNSWLWKLAKAHVLAHDSGWHQLVSHWLRTHGCMEPYIIAANRQLSSMHPVLRLLRPHFRYTMEINSLAREALINGGGIIEICFSPGKYSMELSSVAYDKFWRFDMEALPADLILRGMAVEDPTAEHGLRLTIEDYPYADDGLLVWSAIKQWVDDYVSHYYPDDSLIKSDEELQQFWTEVRTKGHADKKDEPWWPAMDSKENLVHILTTMIWVGSAHHAAVNFGQYHYAGYFPNRATIARTNLPVEEDGEGSERELRRFMEKPERALLQCFPTQIQATLVMAILDVLSTHSPDEEYIGALPPKVWGGNKVVAAAYERFRGRLLLIEGVIDKRNADMSLKNRCGAGVVPYELLKPTSEAGVTGKGVPNSISI